MINYFMGRMSAKLIRWVKQHGMKPGGGWADHVADKK